MIVLRFLILFLIYPCVCFGWGINSPLMAVNSVGGSTPSDICADSILCRFFEPGEDADSGTWDGSHYDFAYSGTDVICVTQSAELDGTGSLGDIHVSFTAESEVWLHFVFKKKVMPTNAFTLVEFYSSSGGELLGKITYTNTTNTLTLYMGTNNSSNATIDWVDDQVIHIFYNADYAAKTSSVYVSADETWPETATITRTGNNTLTSMGYIKFPGHSYFTSMYSYYDQVILKTSSFAEVPVCE